MTPLPLLLPPHWQPTSISDIANGGLFRDGDWVESKDQDSTGTIRLTQLADVGTGKFRDRSNRWMRSDQAERLGCTFLHAGDVLIARMPEPLGRACLVPESVGTAVTAVDVAVLRITRKDVDPRFVMWALNSPEMHAAMVAVQSGTTRGRISRRNLGRVQIPLPTIPEQRRVVEILEGHLSRLDAANAQLSVARARSRSLKAAQLVLACQSPHSVTLGQLRLTAGYGTSTKCIVGGPGPAVVRIPNLVDGRIDLSNEKRVADALIDVSPTLLDEDDLLFVRTNGSRDLIGRTAVVQPGVDAAFASYIIRYKVDRRRVSPSWVRLVTETPEARRSLEGMAASSAGQYNLSLGKLDKLLIPLPSLDVQERRISQCTDDLHAIARLQRATTMADSRSAVLRRSLFEAAFSGRLTGASTDVEIIEELAGV